MVLETKTTGESTVNLMQKMKMRCPTCSKLYEVQASDIQTETPLFECISCNSRFSFHASSAVQSDMVATFLISGQLAEPQLTTDSSNVAERHSTTESTDLKTCPKCAALNPRLAKECYACHVIFEKLEGLPQDTSLKAQPSLVRKWKDLLNDFQNEDLHSDFIRSCQRLDALKFAQVKYEELGRAQGGDALCDQMVGRIQAIQSVAASPKQRQKASSSPMARWQKYLFLGPLFLSVLLILIGLTSVTNRNLIGVGVALGVMVSGLIIMVKGRLHPADFLDD